MRDVNTFADLEAFEVSRDEFRNSVRRADKFNFVTDDVQRAAILRPGDFSWFTK